MEPESTAPQLDESVTAELKRVLALDPTQLTDNDKEFLRARKHYVGRNSREKFSEVFNPPADNKKKDDKKAAGKDATQKEEKKTSEFPEVPDGEDGRNANGANDGDDDEGPDEDQV